MEGMTRHGKGENIEKASRARSPCPCACGRFFELVVRHRGRDQPDTLRLPDETGRSFAGDRRLSNNIGRRRGRDTALIDHLEPLCHVSLRGGGQQPYTCPSFFAAKLTQKAPRAEPKSLRPLQAEKESVLFGIPIAHLTYRSFLTLQRSPLYDSFTFLLPHRL